MGGQRGKPFAYKCLRDKNFDAASKKGLEFCRGPADIAGMTVYRYRIRDMVANPKVRHEHFGSVVRTYGEAFEAAVEYFRKNLGNLPPKKLPRCTIESNRGKAWFTEAQIIVPSVVQALKMDEEVTTDRTGDVFS